MCKNLNRRKTYLLVHGAWHASWCWKFVSPLLKKQGHHVIELDLPGHGNNNLDFKKISLDTYVSYLIDHIKRQNNPVILVGHSMAGVIISQAAEYIPQHIERLVYIAAFVPKNESSLMQEASQSSNLGMSKEATIDRVANVIALKKSSRLQNLFFNACKEEDARFGIESLQSEPFKPFIDKIRISNEKFGSIKKIYIVCLSDKAVAPNDQKRMSSNIDCDVISIVADHSPFFSAVDELVEILLLRN